MLQARTMGGTQYITHAQAYAQLLAEVKEQRRVLGIIEAKAALAAAHVSDDRARLALGDIACIAADVRRPHLRAAS